MRALVTGGTGFVGRALVARLDALGVDTWRFATSLATAGRDIGGDVTDPDDVETAFDIAKPSHVFHLAGTRTRSTLDGEVARLMAVNVLGTQCVALSAARRSIGRLLVLGSAEEYGPITPPFREGDEERPVTAYGKSRLIATRGALHIGEVSDLDVVALRATVAYGPGQASDMFIAGLVESLLGDRPFGMTDGFQTRDFLYIDDLVEALILAARARTSVPRVLNVGSGVPVPIRDVALMAERLAGRSGLVRLGVRSLGEGEAIDYAVDFSAARDALGWRPATGIEAGLKRMLRARRG